MLFASYLFGLLYQPPRLGAYPDLVLIGAASAGACVIGRALLCRHNPARDIRQTRRAYHAASRRAAARLAQFLESGCTPRSGRRLYRLAENGTGAVIAATVATVFLPISTYSVIRTGLLGYLHTT
jgi:hypothetical protein